MKDTKSTKRSSLRRLLGYFTPYKLTLALSLVGAFIVGTANSALAPIAKILMDMFSGVSQAVLSGTPLNLILEQKIGSWQVYRFSVADFAEAKHILLMITIAAFVLVIAKSMVHFGKEFLLWRITHKVLMQLKHELFHRIVRFPLATFEKEKSGEMLSRVTYDVTQVENAIRSGINLVKSFIYSAIYIAMMFYMEWSLTLLALCVFPLSAVLIKLFGDRVRRISRQVSLNVADYTSFLSEAIGGAKVIKAFSREKDQQRSFDNKIRDNYRFSMKIARLNSLHAPAQEIFSTLGMAIVILFCGYRMISGHMTIGDLSGFLVLLTNAYKPIKSLGEANAIIQRAIASSQRIFNLVDQPDESQVIGSGSQRPFPVTGKIEFKRISFQYHSDIPVLREVSMTIDAGETVALVGPSGGGKSTMVSLIPRFYHLTEGSIEIDGVDSAEWELDHLRSQIAVVPQETILFSGTIEDNIQFGRPETTPAEITAAATAANAHQFIETLPNGYHSEVGERGVQLSGGQRQRIAIARAILRDPRILLLDEATSSLDTESERLIQESLDRFRRNRTTIIIAHRLSTVQSADRIAVMVEGRLVEAGPHKELYESGGVYRGLCDQQFKV